MKNFTLYFYRFFKMLFILKIMLFKIQSTIRDALRGCLPLLHGIISLKNIRWMIFSTSILGEIRPYSGGWASYQVFNGYDVTIWLPPPTLFIYKKKRNFWSIYLFSSVWIHGFLFYCCYEASQETGLRNICFTYTHILTYTWIHIKGSRMYHPKMCY